MDDFLDDESFAADVDLLVELEQATSAAPSQLAPSATIPNPVKSSFCQPQQQQIVGIYDSLNAQSPGRAPLGILPATNPRLGSSQTPFSAALTSVRDESAPCENQSLKPAIRHAPASLTFTQKGKHALRESCSQNIDLDKTRTDSALKTGEISSLNKSHLNMTNPRIHPRVIQFDAQTTFADSHDKRKTLPGPISRLPRLTEAQKAALFRIKSKKGFHQEGQKMGLFSAEDNCNNRDSENVHELLSRTQNVVQIELEEVPVKEQDFGAAWFQAKRDHPEWIGNVMLIRDVLSGTVDETMRAPKLFAFIDKIRFHNYDASVTLKDTSGEIEATFHRQVLEDLKDSLMVGTVLMIQDAAVIQWRMKSFQTKKYLMNVTMRNVFHFVCPSSSADIEESITLTQYQRDVLGERTPADQTGYLNDDQSQHSNVEVDLEHYHVDIISSSHDRSNSPDAEETNVASEKSMNSQLNSADSFSSSLLSTFNQPPATLSDQQTGVSMSTNAENLNCIPVSSISQASQNKISMNCQPKNDNQAVFETTDDAFDAAELLLDGLDMTGFDPSLSDLP